MKNGHDYNLGHTRRAITLSNPFVCIVLTLGYIRITLVNFKQYCTRALKAGQILWHCNWKMGNNAITWTKYNVLTLSTTSATLIIVDKRAAEVTIIQFHQESRLHKLPYIHMWHYHIIATLSSTLLKRYFVRPIWFCLVTVIWENILTKART